MIIERWNSYLKSVLEEKDKNYTLFCWQYSERYKVKGVVGCPNRHIDEDAVRKIYLLAWNELLECRDEFLLEGKGTGKDLLTRFRAVDFVELAEHAQPIQELDIDCCFGCWNVSSRMKVA